MVVFRSAPDDPMMRMPERIGTGITGRSSALSKNGLDEQNHHGSDHPARVSCLDCGFRWYGLTAAHGLSIIGCCPRCSGELAFSERVPTVPLKLVDAEFEVPVRGEGDDAALPEAARRVRHARRPAIEPSRVLGVPLTWRR
jgi:hypothetical protein